MRYKRSTYIAINVNIQNINIFSIWYLYYAINSHSHKSGREKRVERDAVENEWKRANSLWICSLCWLIDCLLFFSHFFLARLDICQYWALILIRITGTHARWSSNRFFYRFVSLQKKKLFAQSWVYLICAYLFFSLIVVIEREKICA